MSRLLTEAASTVAEILSPAWLAWIWTWLATVVAVREAMDFDLGRAVLTVVLPTIILIVLFGVAAMLFGFGILTLLLLGR